MYGGGRSRRNVFSQPRSSTIRMFEACATYEAGLSVEPDFPITDSPVWIMGKQYNAKHDLDELKADVKSRIWMTYRKNFPPIGGSGPTSDSGWGCMLRCGQMVLAQALIYRHLGPGWRWTPQCNDTVYAKILRLFEDKKNAIYSIHQIAQMGEAEGKTVGQWFGPNTVAQVLRKLSVYDDWSSMVLCVAMDNTVVINEIKIECKRVVDKPKAETADPDAPRLRNKLNGVIAAPEVVDDVTSGGASSTLGVWRPLLLFIPLRLGLSDINPIYFEGLKKCFALKEFLGLIGGRPNHAYYFIGHVDNDLIFLDPHTTQPTVCLDCADPMCTRLADPSYHCSVISRMDFLMLDPSIALCFYCATEGDFDRLCQDIQTELIDKESSPLFEICKDRPKWFDAQLNSYRLSGYNSEFQIVGAGRNYDTSDDEFELL